MEHKYLSPAHTHLIHLFLKPVSNESQKKYKIDRGWCDALNDYGSTSDVYALYSQLSPRQ